MTTDREKARKLVMEIAKLAEQYKLPIFAVTEGASITRNNGSAAVRNARLAQIKWEKANGEDPDEDWMPKEASSLSDIKSVKDLKNIYDHNRYGVLDRSTNDKHRRGLRRNAIGYYSKDRDKLIKRISQWVADHGGPDHTGGDSMYVREVKKTPTSGVDLQTYISAMQKNPIILKVNPKNNGHK